MPKTTFNFILGCLLGGTLVFVLFKTLFVEYQTVSNLPDGGQYTGERLDNVFHGKGRIEWPNGAYYEGEFENGMIQGVGFLQFPDGSTYEGAFEKGMLHGKGEYHSYGNTYIGQFERDRFNGQGEHILQNGDKYIGEFKHDLYHGHGTYITSSEERYEGEYVEGQFTGRGTYEYPDGIRFEGVFEDWIYSGKGTMTYADGSKLIGEYIDGALNGHGEYFGEDGSYYTGSFENGSYHGYGEYKSPNGDTYSGQFEYGRYHGEGKMAYAKPIDSVENITGVWRRGKLSSCDSGCKIIPESEIAETALYNQNQLLDSQLDNLKSSNEDLIDMYFLGVAGHGSQAVFRREVLYVKDYFESKFHTNNSSVTLINDRSTVHEYPLATATSVRKSLETISEKMNHQEDILFVYLSSHGSKSHDFDIDQPGMRLEDISAESFAGMVKKLPIKWKVIVISACYSGGHIPYLEDENTLIITAADPDRESFGCSDENEFTYFGEAFFKDALPNSDNFVDAFEKAKEIVSKKEKGNDYTPSNPQISNPKAILEQLERWRNELNARSR